MSFVVKYLIIIIIFILAITFWQILINFIYKNGNVTNIMACSFNDTRTEIFDTKRMAYTLIYFVLGLGLPNHYLLTIIISIIFEIAQPYFGYESNYIMGPILNLTSYSIGSMISFPEEYNQEKYKEKYQVLERVTNAI